MSVQRLWKRVLVLAVLVSSSEVAIAQDLTGVWRDENGTRHVIRQSGSDLCWSAERLPAASTVFCATVMPPLIVGTWLDLPTGQRRGAGQLVLRMDSENRIVRVSDAQGSYGASTWIREGTSGAGGGSASSSGGDRGGTAGSSGSGWPTSAPTGGYTAPPGWPTSGSTAPPPLEKRETAPTSPAGRDFTRRQGVTYTGATPIIRFFAMRNAFPQECEAECAKEATCAAYTYVRPGGYKSGDPPVCYLFSQSGPTANHDCCTSGERSTAAAASRTFADPQVNGMAVDHCATWGANCGQGGADLYCKSQGFVRAASFRTAYRSPSYVQGDGQVCRGAACGALTEVVCVNGLAGLTTPPPAVIPPPPPPPATQARTFANPQVNGMAVDHCTTWGANCGQGGADLYCKSQGFVRAASFRTAYRSPSYVQGDGQVCREAGCMALTEVVCVNGLNTPPPAVIPPPPPPAATPSLTGNWRGICGIYKIVQSGNTFTWECGAEKARGTVNGDVLTADWGSGPLGGSIKQRAADGTPIFIHWDNGVDFVREDAPK